MAKNSIVYGSVISPFVRKVLIALGIKQIKYDSITLIPFIESDKEQLLEMNPLGKVPIYREEDFILSDSSVICAYLEKKFPANPLYPANPESFATCLWFEEYADTQLIPAIGTVFFHSTIAKRFNIEPDMAAVKNTLENTLPNIFNYLDEAIGDKSYLIDNHFSLADICMVTPFLNFAFAGHHIDANQWKNLSRYINSLFYQKQVNAVFQKAEETWENIP